MSNSPTTGLTAASAVVVMTILAASIGSQGKAMPPSGPPPDDRYLWFERDENLEWAKQQLSPDGRGKRRGRDGFGPRGGPLRKRRHQRRQP